MRDRTGGERRGRRASAGHAYASVRGAEDFVIRDRRDMGGSPSPFERHSAPIGVIRASRRRVSRALERVRAERGDGGEASYRAVPR